MRRPSWCPHQPAIEHFRAMRTHLTPRPAGAVPASAEAGPQLRSQRVPSPPVTSVEGSGTVLPQEWTSSTRRPARCGGLPRGSGRRLAPPGAGRTTSYRQSSVARRRSVGLLGQAPLRLKTRARSRRAPSTTPLGACQRCLGTDPASSGHTSRRQGSSRPDGSRGVPWQWPRLLDAR
jgi:hypothetical protein